MGKIKIGSSKEKKGITINPKTILFNGNNVNAINKGDTTVYRMDLLATITLINTSSNPRYASYRQVNADGSVVNTGNVDDYNGTYINISWGSGHRYTLKSGYLFEVDINESIDQHGAITKDGDYTSGDICSSNYGNVTVATVKVYPL